MDNKYLEKLAEIKNPDDRVKFVQKALQATRSYKLGTTGVLSLNAGASLGKYLQRKNT